MSSETPSESNIEHLPSEAGDSPSVPHNGVVESLKEELREVLLQGETLVASRQLGNPVAGFVSNLTENQKDKLIDIFSKNEDNALTYHSKKLDTVKEIELERIRSKGQGLSVFKQIAIGVLAVFLLITVLLIVFKPDLLNTWLAFVMGLGGGGLGGFGLAKSSSLNSTQQSSAAKELSDEGSK